MIDKNRAFIAPGERIWIHVATCPSNTWFGASQVLGQMYEPYTLRPCDVVLDLVGGTFVVISAGDDPSQYPIYEYVIHPNEKHPFLKVYQPVERARVPARATEVPYEGPLAAWGQLVDHPFIDQFPPDRGIQFGALDWRVPEGTFTAEVLT